jgi:hypothetical protein
MKPQSSGCRNITPIATRGSSALGRLADSVAVWHMSSTRIACRLDAPRSRVYAALVDGGAIAKWKCPDGMTIDVHEFEGREGGRFRVSLTYAAPGQAARRLHTPTPTAALVEAG